MTDNILSNCNSKLTERKWTQLLLNWLNLCVTHKNVSDLGIKSLTEVINKYKEDIFSDFDNIIISLEDIEVYLAYKFHKLDLGNLNRYEFKSSKSYILASILLYYCCTNTKTGQVDEDICKNLTSDEQIMILKFCEALALVEPTINNVETAIKAACKTNNQERIIREKRGIHVDSVSTQPSTSVSSADDPRKVLTLKFKSPITVLPSVTVTDTSLSKSDLERSDDSELRIAYLGTGCERQINPLWNAPNAVEMNAQGQEINSNELDYKGNVRKKNLDPQGSSDHFCQFDCACTRCSPTGPCCGDPGCTKELCDDPKTIRKIQASITWKCFVIIGSILAFLLIVTLSIIPILMKRNSEYLHGDLTLEDHSQENLVWTWICKANFCQRVFNRTPDINAYLSLSRCTLLCTGLQLWPYPIGKLYYSKNIVALTTKKLEYKFLSTPSDEVQKYLAEAFKLFLGDLSKLERSSRSCNRNNDLLKINIQIAVESDPDPRLRVNTEESYTLKLETINDRILIKINSVSFCGTRHGIETLSQLILLDESTGNLITLSKIYIKDAPSYRYRGLMIDTARNFIPVTDLLRTIDGMATCKLNTLHWRVSDATSFPFYLDKVPELFEYGPYDRAMVYSNEDVKLLVKRAGIRGIRILIEVSVPGLVGRPWAWLPETTCPKTDNFTCDNILCLQLSIDNPVFNVLQKIYSEIIHLTNVDDIFHLSNSVSTITYCYNLVKESERFLDKALERLKIANKGFLPTLPIVWYTSHLTKHFEATTWERLGVQLNDWNSNALDQNLSKFRVIHSSKWSLSCEMRKRRCTKYKTWQQMYAWKSWRNVNVITIEGGESILWTDLVDSSNLDYHLWPRAAAVAERLWSDVVANSTANRFVYLRLDSHRRRMFLRGININPIWPEWCSYNPSSCLDNVH